MLAEHDEGRLEELRQVVYRTLVEEGRPPTADEAARRLGTGEDGVLAGWRLLHDRHLLVLDDDRTTIRMAHPFSARWMGFLVASAEQKWWGGCAWDSFGIMAALDRPLVGRRGVDLLQHPPGVRRRARTRRRRRRGPAHDVAPGRRLVRRPAPRRLPAPDPHGGERDLRGPRAHRPVLGAARLSQPSLVRARRRLRTPCWMRCSFSINANRTWPSPPGPKPIPGEVATLASLTRKDANSTEPISRYGSGIGAHTNIVPSGGMTSQPMRWSPPQSVSRRDW